MSGNKKMMVFYAVALALSLFASATIRWYSYRTPQEERVVTDEHLDMDDPRLKDFGEVKEGLEYFMRQETITTKVSGTFPLVNEKKLVITTRWYRPSYR